MGMEMGDSLQSRDTAQLVGILESLLDELDQRNLIQSAAKLASAIDTLRLEAEAAGAPC
jgi:hypothetical protein